MFYSFFIPFTYIIISFFLFNLWENFKLENLPFFTILILLIFFFQKKDLNFKIFTIFLSLAFIFISSISLHHYFYLSVLLLIILWFNYYLIKNPKMLFIFNLLYGFLLFFSISSFKEINLPNFLIALHFALPFSLSFIKNTLYLNQVPNFPYAHIIPMLFGITGVIFIILRIYSYLLFIPLFILLSISIFATFYQPPYKKPYPLIYQSCIIISGILNYFGLKLMM